MERPSYLLKVLRLCVVYGAESIQLRANFLVITRLNCSCGVMFCCDVLSGVKEFFDTLSSCCGLLHMNCTVSLLTAYMTEGLRRLQRGTTV